MKKLIFLLGIFVFSVAFAQDVDMSIIGKIESNFSPYAYNYKSGARGICQVTESVLREFYNFHAGKVIKKDLLAMGFNWNENVLDLYNPMFNLYVANWYMNNRIPEMLKSYHLPDTIDNRLRCYNSGIGTVLKGKTPSETRKYIIKYHKLEKEL